MSFRKPEYFLLDEPTKTIWRLHTTCPHEAEYARGRLGLTLTASIYCGVTDYARLNQLKGWTTKHPDFPLRNDNA